MERQNSGFKMPLQGVSFKLSTRLVKVDPLT